jgi:hypothetical protein
VIQKVPVAAPCNCEARAPQAYVPPPCECEGYGQPTTYGHQTYPTHVQTYPTHMQYPVHPGRVY